MDELLNAETPTSQLGHNNQIQVAVLLAAHYTATRNSVDDWLRRRDQYLMLFVTGVAAIFSVFLARTDSPLILYMIAPLTFVFLGAYLSADLHVAYLCKWLKEEYTNLLEQYVRAYGVISFMPWHWDNSAALSEFYSRGIGRQRYTFIGLIFILANFAVMVLANTFTNEMHITLLVLSLLAAILPSGALVHVYISRKNMALKSKGSASQ